MACISGKLNRVKIGPVDRYLLARGQHYRLYEKMGAHIIWDGERVAGVHFAVWAPNARSVRVIGEANQWGESERNSPDFQMQFDQGTGIWSVFSQRFGPGSLYKFQVEGFWGGSIDKSDPFAFRNQCPNQKGRFGTASEVADPFSYVWNDRSWIEKREAVQAANRPMSVYEMHLGSWKMLPTYRSLASELPEYLRHMGFTHVEFLPIAEHYYYPSWGYLVNNYFAPTSRYGSLADFMNLIDTLHQNGFGVIMDWVPGHFPKDEAALGRFDGTALYEHDGFMGEHPHWCSYIFNYGRDEVRSFLISNADFWARVMHVDALRIDALASMLYLDYGRGGNFVPNNSGGHINLGAVSLMQDLNAWVHCPEKGYPNITTIAEESTSFPGVTRPVWDGGLGFDIKWAMGWMSDTLKYLEADPLFRSSRFLHDRLTFYPMYAHSENFMLPLSHDEVVHLKRALVEKMPGDDWKKFANIRLLFALMFLMSGKKLIFMGGEFGQRQEWSHDRSIDWHLAEFGDHRGLMDLVRDLNRLYAHVPALHEKDFDPAGFRWIDCSDNDNSIVSFLRYGDELSDPVAAVFNFTPVIRRGYMVGLPFGGDWREILNTDASVYGGTNTGNHGIVTAYKYLLHRLPYAAAMTLPPLGAIMLRHSRYLSLQRDTGEK